MESMITINLYKYSGHRDTINKQLGDAVAIAGLLRDMSDILNLSVIIRGSTPIIANYAEIPAFGRFYFVDSVTVLAADKTELRLRCDVLKTYENDILNTTATAIESDNPNPYISTRQAVYEMTPNFERRNFPVTGLFNDEGSIIMVTIKGENN